MGSANNLKVWGGVDTLEGRAVNTVKTQKFENVGKRGVHEPPPKLLWWRHPWFWYMVILKIHLRLIEFQFILFDYIAKVFAPVRPAST